jgi:hypothetical protein
MMHCYIIESIKQKITSEILNIYRNYYKKKRQLIIIYLINVAIIQRGLNRLVELSI